MIQKVRFRDLRAFREASFSLRPLTVIVGPNGSGKTTLLHGLFYAALTLGLLTVLHQESQPTLILWDDMERGLHPEAMLIEQVRRIQEHDPELQIVATTHSPYLLDCLDREEVLVTALRPDGSAVVKPLTEHPDIDQWRDLMAPGEFWSTVGESWVAEDPVPYEYEA